MTDRADMLDPADPPSPLDLREALERIAYWEGEQTPPHDGFSDWHFDCGPECPARIARAALASSPAPAGLDRNAAQATDVYVAAFSDRLRYHGGINDGVVHAHNVCELLDLLDAALASSPAPAGLDAEDIADGVRFARGGGTSDYWRGWNDGIDKLVEAIHAATRPAEDARP